jgi:hypothetical protein
MENKYDLLLLIKTLFIPLLILCDPAMLFCGGEEKFFFSAVCSAFGERIMALKTVLLKIHEEFFDVCPFFSLSLRDLSGQSDGNFLRFQSYFLVLVSVTHRHRLDSIHFQFYS